MVTFRGINHLALVTSNMDETIRFWRDLLGMRLVVGLGHPGYRHYFFEISPGNMIAFFEWPGTLPAPEKDHGAPVTGPVAFDHVSFNVDSRQDLWDLKDKLEAAGFWASEVVDHGFIHSLYSFDPNNIPIEFSFGIRMAEISEAPVLADSDPSSIALEGSEPQPEKWPPVEEPTSPEDRKIYPGLGSELFHGTDDGKRSSDSDD